MIYLRPARRIFNRLICPADLHGCATVSIVAKNRELANLGRSFFTVSLQRLAGMVDRIRSRPVSAGRGDNTGSLQVEMPLVVVGDVHGRLDLLNKMLEKLEVQAPGAKQIFVGDYVDRGPDARAVLDCLRALDGDAVCLKGNHEAMLLEFLDNPIRSGARWLANGGQQTLASYGIALDQGSGVDEVSAASAALRIALSDGTESWLRALPVYWQNGGLLVTHAGPDPAKAIAGQQERVFLWGHDRFLRAQRSDGIWVAHGHWVQQRANCIDGRIAVDTGAWRTGRLSAALIEPDGSVRIIVAK